MQPSQSEVGEPRCVIQTAEERILSVFVCSTFHFKKNPADCLGAVKH